MASWGLKCATLSSHTNVNKQHRYTSWNDTPNLLYTLLGCVFIQIKMRAYKQELEIIANDILNQNAEAKGNENKPNYTNREFMNALIIFQTALMDKMWDMQTFDKLEFKDRENMAVQCGLDLRKLILTYTGLDTHKIEEFL